MAGLSIIIKPGDPAMEEYADARFERQAHGSIMLGGQEVAHSLQCPHCGGHFISRRGSGHTRTWCMNCNAVTCGGPNCRNCVTWERKMEMIELKASRDYRYQQSEK